MKRSENLTFDEWLKREWGTGGDTKLFLCLAFATLTICGLCAVTFWVVAPMFVLIAAFLGALFYWALHKKYKDYVTSLIN